MVINQQAAARRVRYSPGYRFLPKDDELIVEYLMKKINNQPIPIDDIAVVNFNDHDPDTLSGAYPPLGDKEWYFFALRNRKHQNGSRPDRTTANGFWKATGADVPVTDINKVVVGSKRSLKFWEGTSSNPIKTDWIMHEYMAASNHQPSRGKRDANGNTKLDDVVLCRIHKKPVKADKNRGLASDHGVPVPALQLRMQTEEEGPIAQIEGVSSSEFATAADEEQWRKTEDEAGVSAFEFAGDEDFWESSLEGPTGEEDKQQHVDLSSWTSSIEGFLNTEDEPQLDGVYPSEVAANVEGWRMVWDGLPTDEEEEQQPPQKRVRHLYQF